jgi:hypothetical protein
VLLVAASRPIFALIRPYALSLIGFQTELLLLQQYGKYILHMMPYLPHLDKAARANSKFNLLSHY